MTTGETPGRADRGSLASLWCESSAAAALATMVNGRSDMPHPGKTDAALTYVGRTGAHRKGTGMMKAAEFALHTLTFGRQKGTTPMQARIRQMGRFAVVVVGLVAVLPGAALAQASNPMIGTWKLNVAKSK